MSSASQGPNILFIVVDEMRYPMHFPEGVDSAAAFLEKFMPNVYNYLWKDGVKFSRYYTAASDCSPGRGTFVTGLYAQQTNLMLVRGTQHSKYQAPELQRIFPTYGKLLREAQYSTPYIGKWHLSNAVSHDGKYLDQYGFDGQTIPDPNGVAGQGIGAAKGQIGDHHIALKAVEWLRKHGETDTPFCLTVGFINPHDKQWFWTGPQPQQRVAAYAAQNRTPFPSLSQLEKLIYPKGLPNTPNIQGESDPSPYGYKKPDNWQPHKQLREKGQPVLAHVFGELTDFSCGGITDDPCMTKFDTRPSELCPGWFAPFAPYSYWTQALDMYTYVMNRVDTEIGLLLGRIPPKMLANMVIVFTSDHGEYASSHGLQGKGYTAYEETVRVPLIVRDHTGRFAKNTHIERTQIGSSVDLLRMLVNIGHDGNETEWLTGEMKEMYGRRADLLSIVGDHKATGREFAAYTCDEGLIPEALNFANAPEHVGALIFPDGKFTVFSRWAPALNPRAPAVSPAEHFYYDYSTRPGALELESSTPPRSPFDLMEQLQIEIQAPLPERYWPAQKRALDEYWTYLAVVESIAKEMVRLSKTSLSDLPLERPDALYIPTLNAPQEAAAIEPHL